MGGEPNARHQRRRAATSAACCCSAAVVSQRAPTSDGAAETAEVPNTEQALLEELRGAPPQQDADSQPLWPAVAVDPSRPVGKGNPPRGRRS